MKYIVKAKIEVDGIVDRPDIIGAIFGQTEGLFGPEFDLRELQEKGRIGRIYVESKNVGNKTVGEIIIPSNLDKSETALLAAMIETVDRVGPYNARIHVVELVDLRLEKIKRIVERAKEFMNKWNREKTPDLKEILNEINSVVKTAAITTYGPERLPAGPEVATSDTIIIVEGRADVLNLLRAGYKNVIAIEGAQGRVPESIVKLAQKKNVIVFVDGDRAGDMILKTLIESIKVDYVARAPPGREVEELSIKEIEKALKNAIPVSEYLKQLEKKREAKVAETVQQAVREERPVEVQATVPTPTQPVAEASISTAPTTAETPVEAGTEARETTEPLQTGATVTTGEEVSKIETTTETVPVPEETGALQVPEHVINEIRGMVGTLTSVVYDSEWNIVTKLGVRDLYDYLEKYSDENRSIYAVVLDGIVTQRLVDAARRRGIKMIIGYRVGSQVSRSLEDLRIYTFDEVLKKTSS